MSKKFLNFEIPNNLRDHIPPRNLDFMALIHKCRVILEELRELCKVGTSFIWIRFAKPLVSIRLLLLLFRIRLIRLLLYNSAILGDDVESCINRSAAQPELEYTLGPHL